jgi:hypothetical protein
VDEAAEEVASAEAGGRVEWRRVAAGGRQELQRPMWPVLVVMAAVDAEHVLEVAAAQDEDPVEAVGANGAHPALGKGVRVRSMDRCADHPDVLGAEDLVEGVAELRVTIADEEPERLLVAAEDLYRALWVPKTEIRTAADRGAGGLHRCASSATHAADLSACSVSWSLARLPRA